MDAQAAPLAPGGRSPAEILIVDDDPTAITSLKSILGGQGRLRFATSGSEALRLARHSVPDLVLLDVEMPGLSGFEVCRALKLDPQTREVPVIFITGHNETEEELTGLSLGAVDFIAKPPSPPLVCARVQTHLRLKRLSDTLRRAASEDPLTGAANRRRFDEALQAEWSRNRRNGQPMSLLMVDIDFFKAYNDRYGHPAGDQCLRQVSQALQQCIHRPADLLARLGGEEFAVLLPDTDAEGAAVVARRVMAAAAALGMAHEASATGHVTWSVGAASTTAGAPGEAGAPLPEPAAQDLVAVADHALYEAKRQGRAQWQAETLPVPPPPASPPPPLPPGDA